jgi:hypothetical protein
MAESDAQQPGGARRKRGKDEADSAIIFALLLGSTQEAAATHAHVSIKTVARRLRSLSFLRRLAEARKEVVRRSIDKCTYYGMAALDRLYQLSQSNSEAIAVGACRSLLEASFSARAKVAASKGLAATVIFGAVKM